MKLPDSPTGRLLERGVWKAPWMGPDGEIVLLAVTADHRLLIPPSVIALGSNHFKAYDGLWELLDARDPVSVESDDVIRRRKLRVV
jgi:hypothetical protein